MTRGPPSGLPPPPSAPRLRPHPARRGRPQLLCDLSPPSLPRPCPCPRPDPDLSMSPTTSTSPPPPSSDTPWGRRPRKGQGASVVRLQMATKVNRWSKLSLVTPSAAVRPAPSAPPRKAPPARRAQEGGGGCQRIGCGRGKGGEVLAPHTMQAGHAGVLFGGGWVRSGRT